MTARELALTHELADALRAADLRKAEDAELLKIAAAALLIANDELKDERRTRERLADLLKRSAIALKGPEPPDVMWDWSDIPERIAALKTQHWTILARALRKVLPLDMQESVAAVCRDALARAAFEEREDVARRLAAANAMRTE